MELPANNVAASSSMPTLLTGMSSLPKQNISHVMQYVDGDFPGGTIMYAGHEIELQACGGLIMTRWQQICTR